MHRPVLVCVGAHCMRPFLLTCLVYIFTGLAVLVEF